MPAQPPARAGQTDIVIAGGQENMSAAPHVLNGSRDGFRMGDAKLVDSMIVDGLWDAYNHYHMGVTAENVGEFLKAGAMATAAGSSLVDAKAFKERNWAAITAKAKAFAEAVSRSGTS